MASTLPPELVECIALQAYSLSDHVAFSQTCRSTRTIYTEKHWQTTLRKYGLSRCIKDQHLLFSELACRIVLHAKGCLVCQDVLDLQAQGHPDLYYPYRDDSSNLLSILHPSDEHLARRPDLCSIEGLPQPWLTLRIESGGDALAVIQPIISYDLACPYEHEPLRDRQLRLRMRTVQQKPLVLQHIMLSSLLANGKEEWAVDAFMVSMEKRFSGGAGTMPAEAQVWVSNKDGVTVFDLLDLAPKLQIPNWASGLYQYGGIGGWDGALDVVWQKKR